MPKTILIVDDSALILMSLSTTLKINNFNVETASDGTKALDKLKGGLKPDLIVTDINMPNMGGLELIRNIRALPSFRFTPILVLTTESQASKREEAKKNGATGWLIKPGMSIVAVVKQVLPGA